MGICQIIISLSDTDEALPFSGGVTLAWCDSLATLFALTRIIASRTLLTEVYGVFLMHQNTEKAIDPEVWHAH